jgi:carbon monoxide dehydrogenase subunit G
MTVRISRELTVPASPDRVWEFIADPDNRAAAISVVADWEPGPDGGTVWHVKLPIPIINRTIRVETRDRERTRPEKVSFVGTSTVFRVQGEHLLEPTEEGGTRLTNRFVVDGKAPGVESFFKGRLDDELDNLEAALRTALAEDEAVPDLQTEDA